MLDIINYTMSLDNSTTSLYQLDGLENELASSSMPQITLMCLDEPVKNVTSTGLSPRGILDNVDSISSLLLVPASYNKSNNFGE